jgi:hypothetical protein
MFSVLRVYLRTMVPKVTVHQGDVRQDMSHRGRVLATATALAKRSMSLIELFALSIIDPF